jgi:hypothetical protein
MELLCQSGSDLVQAVAGSANKVGPNVGCGMRLAVKLRDENPTKNSAAAFSS